ncbi:unnamed protein product [Symbiodinium pilosum]|uniref:Cyclic phosphodiesterase n=1 Tax=Symbiodinium pilosum TaxID=2952 RepID=A0A812QYL1_SYMPI|nr:unnamed protein product [Symbiodinium pilosum]
MAATAYSLWLLPDVEKQGRLDDLVGRVAKEFNSSCFDFHVTLLGGIKSDNLPDLKASLVRLAGSLQPFDISFGTNSIAVYDTWNQNLLLLAEDSPALNTANLAAHRTFTDAAAQEAAFAAPSMRPHGSLLYGPHSMEERRQAEEWVRKEGCCSTAFWILMHT